MNHIHRIVPASLFAMSLLLLPGCDGSGSTPTTASTVKPASNTAAATPSEPAKPVTEPAVKSELAAQAVSPAVSPDSAVDTLAPQQPPRVAAPPQPGYSTTLIVKADPSEVDLGEIPTNDTKAAKVKLVNTGDKAMTIISARPSCGCTALKFQPNTVIEANSSIEVDLQMSGGAKPGEIHGKTVTFVVEGQPEIIVPLKGRAVSFVVSEPDALDPSTMPDGKFKLKSIDDQPFKIVSVQPQVVEDLGKDAAVEHTLAVSWDKYREQGISRQLIVYLDHPKCQQVFMQVNWKPDELAAQAAELQKQRQNNKEALKGPGAVNAPAQMIPEADPDTVLANLIKEGKNTEVLQKLQTGLDVNYRNNGGISLLGMAAAAGNTDLVKALLATGKVDINSTDNVGRTALMHAAGSKNAETVRVLLAAGSSPTTRDNLGTTALSWAAWLGDAESVSVLLEAGSDAEVVGTITGWTPLILAAGFGDPKSIDPLLKAHAKIEAQDLLEGATPLIHASRTGNIENIRILVKNGANLENTDHNGNTPLLACAKTSGGDADKIKVLIELGANIHAKDNRGYNALELAKKRTDIRAADIIKVLEPLLGNETPATATTDGKPAAGS